MTDREYYWARGPREELEQDIVQRINDYYEHIESTGRLRLWRASIRAYRGTDAQGGWDSSTVGFGGEQGEQVRFKINHYGGILQGIHTLITGSPPTTRAVAATADRAGMDQAAVADKLLDYDRKMSQLARLFDRAALYMLHSAEGWIYQGWDMWRGREVGTQPIDADGMPVGEEADPETGEPTEPAGERIVYEGDVVTECLHPIDVWRDPDTQLDAGRPHTWLGCRRRVSRWELVARYPEYRTEILDAQSWGKDGGGHERELFDPPGGETDKVYLYEWYHPPSAALPMGRFAWLVGDKIIDDGPYPYAPDELPLYDAMPDVLEDSCFGFTPAWHLLAPQEAYDAIVSSAVSNLETFGVQNIWCGEPGDQLDIDKMAGGMNMLYGRTRPEALQLTDISEHAYKVLDLLQDAMEMLSGANRTMRGDPQANLKSGSALALVQALAVQHNSGHHRSYANLVERVFTGRIKLWQRFVSIPRKAEIIGDDERVAAQEWSADTISQVSRVTVEMTNPIWATSEGKYQLAQQLADRQWCDRHEFMQVVATGRLDPILKRDQAEKRLILRENDRMRRSEEVKAVWTDRHRMHMREHSVELSDPAIRFDDEAVMRIAAHINEHRDLLFNTPPELLEAIGEPPPQMAPEQAGPPGPGDGPPPPGGPGEPAPGPAGPGPLPNLPAIGNQPVSNPMGGHAAGLPKMPQMPSPGTRVNPAEPQFGP